MYEEIELMRISFKKIIIFVILSIASGIVLVVLRNQPYTFNAREELQELSISGAETFPLLRNNLDSIIARGGIRGMMDVLRIAWKDKRISINQCHTILHLVGHKAYHFFAYDLERIAAEDIKLCGSAYHHGVEAEIVTVQDVLPAIREELFRYCKLVGHSVACFHGAGHAFMGRSLDTSASLQACDALSGGPQTDLMECYKGVFSETAFQIAGIDGDTGLSVSGGPQIKFEYTHPLDFCQTLEDRYQSACALQLSRVAFGRFDREGILQQCMNPVYSDVLQMGCIQNAAAIFGQADLSQYGRVDIPDIVFSIPKKFREAYILGIGQEYGAFISSGGRLDIFVICSEFVESADRNFCENVMEQNS